MTMPTFDLPRSFHPTECLPGRLVIKADYARWLVSTILRKMARGGRDTLGLARLHSDILYRVLGRDVAKIVQALEAGHAIETTPYRPGAQTRGYRLAHRFLDDRLVRVPCTNPVLRGRLAREAERMEIAAKQARTRWQPIHHALDAEQRSLSIDGPAADAMLDGLDNPHAKLSQDVLVNDLKRRAYRFSVGTTGRIYNSLSSLKSELRGAVRLAGDGIGCVDIKNSQPAILGCLLAPPQVSQKVCKHRCTPLPSVPLPSSAPCLSASVLASCLLSSVAAFRDVASSGTLYDHLADLCGLPRAEVKRRFLVDVLAKKGRYPSEVEDAFRSEYPAVWSAIQEVNHDSHCNLIRLLQEAEAWLVVENVAPRLVGRVPTVTLHDAVYSRADKLAVVEAAFDDVFAALGFRLALKREGTSDA